MKKLFVIIVCLLSLFITTACSEKEPVKSEITLPSGTVVTVTGKEDRTTNGSPSTVYEMNYNSSDEAILHFISDLELLSQKNKQGFFYGYINQNRFASLGTFDSKRIRDNSISYFLCLNIDIPEIQKQYVQSKISEHDTLNRDKFNKNSE